MLIPALHAAAQGPGLVISGFMANPASDDVNKEFVELTATQSINFATTPYSVVFADGDLASTSGWRTGSTGSYGFDINSGTVVAGDKIYVGGNSTATSYLTGSSCKTYLRNTASSGASFGSGATPGGVLGNGGGNADGLAVFLGAASVITTTSVPIDAIFFGDGTGTGTGGVGSATNKFTVPTNDRYSNAAGKFGSTGNTFLASDPGSDDFIKATGTYNASTNSWSTNRTWAATNPNPALVNCGTASSVTISTSGTIAFSLNTAATTSYLQAPDISGVVNDPTDPAATLGLNFIITENSVAVPAANYTLTATSSATAVVPVSGIQITKSAGTAIVKIVPAGVGYTTITLTLTKGSSTSTYQVNFAASAASTTPAGTLFHTGYSDGSSAVALDNDYMVVPDDENNTLSVYNRNNSGLPVKTFSYASGLALTDLSGGVPREVDVEASAKSINTANRYFWLGSMSNKSSDAPFADRPNRNRLFATTITGTGSAATFAMNGVYSNLRARLILWGDANSLGFTASAADGKDPKQIDGFNIEGMAFAPDNTTMYLGFRAPLLPTTSRVNALIAPILNFESWFGAGSPGNPSFGQPILLNLNGRGIREIARYANNGYIILAGDYDDAGVRNTRVYRWNGNAVDAPIELTSFDGTSLNMEGVLPVYSGAVLQTNKLQVISDLGAQAPYNDGVAGKDLATANFKKFRSDILVSAGTPLPVRFLAFSAKLRDAKTASINWKFEAAEGSSFEVQRSSDGKDFRTVSTVPGAAETIDYSAEDLLAQNEAVSYYRIKATQPDGSAFYTNLEMLRRSSKTLEVSVFPNPVIDGSLHLTIPGGNEPGNYTIRNISGNSLRSGTIQAGHQTIDVRDLAAGEYLISVTAGSRQEQLRFSKK